MAMLPAYSPMAGKKLVNQPTPSQPSHTTLGLPPNNFTTYDRRPRPNTVLGGRNLIESNGPLNDPSHFQDPKYNFPPRAEDGGKRTTGLPQITPPGELMYDTGSGYVPLYQDIGLGGGAQGTFRNMSLSGRPIYSATGGIQDFSKVAVQANPGGAVPRYSPYYSMSESGQPQVVGSMTSGIPHEQMAGPVYRPTSDANLGTQLNASGGSLQDYFFDMMMNRVVPGYGEGGGQGGLDWEAMFSQLQTLTNPSDPDSIETLRRLFGLT